MTLQEKSTAAVVLAVVVSLVTIIAFAGTFISKQTAVEVQLVQVQKELVSISTKIDDREKKIEDLYERIIYLETREVGR